MVYVLNCEGNPLMPTKRFGKVRRMLKDNRARVVRAKPFTIQLTYETTNYVQPVTLGIDAGYETVGFSAVTEKEELIAGECQLLTGQTERNKERAMYRRERRNRLRYRKPRFDNRKKPAGWLSPSIQHKLDSHIRLVNLVKSILPVTRVVIEVAKKARRILFTELVKIRDKIAQTKPAHIDFDVVSDEEINQIRAYWVKIDNLTPWGDNQLKLFK